ncbi:MAG TPA: hypothetical protein VFX98_03585 [Longimicrobiaceae bacterium]|nr:hypothetical protein [Longimicrobiaceae bacterium]
MYRNRIIVSSLTLAALLGACSDVQLPTPDAAEVTPASRPAAAVQVVARSFALALASPETRGDVRDAMRASPFTEHKLELHAFIATPRGERLLAAAASASGLTRAELEGMIRTLPEMDFYAPFRTHRLNWEGTADVLVAAALTLDGDRAAAYGTDGDEVTLAFGDDEPTRPVLMLHPAERKGLRMRPQANRPGLVIQDFNDGELSGTFVTRNARGEVQEVSLAELASGSNPRYEMAMPCETEYAITECDYNYGGGGGGGGGTTPSPGTTYLDYLNINYKDFGGSELIFTARYYNSAGTQVASDELRVEGLAKGETYHPHLPLIGQRILEGSSEKINVKVEEDDSWFTFGNDQMGNRDFFASDRGQIRSITKSPTDFSVTTNVELDWTPRY